MTTVSKKQKWFNAIQLTRDDDLYVGIDAHKKTSTVPSGADPSTMLTPLLTLVVALKTLDIFVR
jgi:hypothetical protein